MNLEENDVPNDIHSRKKKSMEFNGVQQMFGYRHSSKYLLLCSAEERNSYRFETTWRWI